MNEQPEAAHAASEFDDYPGDPKKIEFALVALILSILLVIGSSLVVFFISD